MRRVLGAVLIILSAGCYHATVETGAPASNETVTKAWASGWIFGLVPPSTVETVSKCPNGVSKVETQLSFVNQLVSFLTLYIYTPMSIKATCSARRSADNTEGAVIRVGQDAPSFKEAFQAAVELSFKLRQPVFIQE